MARRFKNPPFITFSINSAIMRVLQKNPRVFFHENPRNVYIKRIKTKKGKSAPQNNTVAYYDTYQNADMYYVFVFFLLMYTFRGFS